MNEQAAVVTSDAQSVIIIMSRDDLELERRHLLARLQHLNKLLGYTPVETGKQQRKQPA